MPTNAKSNFSCQQSSTLGPRLTLTADSMGRYVEDFMKEFSKRKVSVAKWDIEELKC